VKGVAPSRLTFGVSCHQNGASSIPDCWHPARLLSGLDPLLGSGRTATESNRLIASLHDVTVVREAIECAHDLSGFFGPVLTRNSGLGC
jgi:hypothetical protein